MFKVVFSYKLDGEVRVKGIDANNMHQILEVVEALKDTFGEELIKCKVYDRRKLGPLYCVQIVGYKSVEYLYFRTKEEAKEEVNKWKGVKYACASLLRGLV